MAGFHKKQPEVTGAKDQNTTSKAVGIAATSRMNKRKRASRRVPTTVLEASSTNFRDMVQKLTGIPAPAPLPSGAELARPQPSKRAANIQTLLARGFDDRSCDAVPPAPPSQPRPSALSDLSDADFFQLFLRSNMACGAPLEVAEAAGEHSPVPNIPVHLPSLWEAVGPSARRSHIVGHDAFSEHHATAPGLDDKEVLHSSSDAYTTAPENQIGQFAWRDQLSLNHMDSWYQIDQVAAMRA